MDAFWSRFDAAKLDSLSAEASEREVRAWLSDIDGRLDCDVLSVSTERTLVLTPRAERRLRPMVSALVGRAPQGLGLRVVEHCPPLSLSTAVERARSQTGVDLSGAKVRAGFSRGHLLDIVVHSPEIASSEDERGIAAAELCVESLLGERIFDDWIGAVRVAAMPRGGPLRVVSEDGGGAEKLPLAELSPTVRAAIEGLIGGLPAEPPSAPPPDAEGWTLFEAEPMAASDYSAQDDLAFATTCAPELLKCFLEGAPFSSRRFSRSGELFAYLKLESGGAGEERLSFRTDLEDAIAAELPPSAGRVIGNGLGVRYVYLDLALADLDAAVATVTAAARRLRVPERSWLLFCDSDWADEWIGLWDATPPPP